MTEYKLGVLLRPLFLMIKLTFSIKGDLALRLGLATSFEHSFNCPKRHSISESYIRKLFKNILVFRI